MPSTGIKLEASQLRTGIKRWLSYNYAIIENPKKRYLMRLNAQYKVKTFINHFDKVHPPSDPSETIHQRLGKLGYLDLKSLEEAKKRIIKENW